jgi:hypothetical protein
MFERKEELRKMFRRRLGEVNAKLRISGLHRNEIRDLSRLTRIVKTLKSGTIIFSGMLLRWERKVERIHFAAWRNYLKKSESNDHEKCNNNNNIKADYKEKLRETCRTSLLYNYHNSGLYIVLANI